jgi:hypothetical protein
MIGVGIKTNIGPVRSGGLNWSNGWTSAYTNDVKSDGGIIVDSAAVLSELNYIKENGLENKIAYQVNKNFGFKQGTRFTGRKPFVIFSFDDGKKGDLDTYNRFKAKGDAVGTFFINGKFIDIDGNYLTSANIATMYAGGADFQCHSFSHAMMDIYGSTSELWQLTEEEQHAEFTNQNAFFASKGLPIPVHHATPRYINDNIGIGIVKQYRKTVRGRNRDLNNWSDRWDYYRLNDYGSEGYSTGYGGTNLATLISYASGAKAYNSVIHLHGHSTDDSDFPQFLQYLIDNNIEYGSVSEGYEIINDYQHRYYNLFERTYADISVKGYFENRDQIGDWNGIIIFNDTFANITAPVVQRYKDAGYNTLFWNDDSAEALACLLPITERYFDEEAVVASVDDKITFSVEHGMLTGDNFFLTGTTPPEGLSFNTMYQVQARAGNSAFYVKLPGGARIDITSAGEGVKLSTYLPKEIVPGLDAVVPLNTLEQFMKRTTYIDAAGTNRYLSIGNYNFVGTFDKLNISLFKHFNGYVTGAYNKISELSDAVLNMIPSWFDFRSNLLASGLQKVFELHFTLRVYLTSNPLLVENIPSTIFQLAAADTIELCFCGLTGSIPREVGQCTNLTIFYTFDNDMTGAIPVELATLIKIQRFRFQNNGYSSYETGAISTGMTALVELNFSGNAFTDAAEINKILADCVLHEAANGTNVTLNLTGGTNAAPTGQGITDKNALNAAGWTVTTN